MSTVTLSPPLSSVNVSPIVSQQEILAALMSGKMTQEKASELLAGMLKDAQSKTVQSGPLFCKVGEKGAVSVYGLNSPRFPVTLYAAQWERLAGFIPSVLDFIKQNEGKTIIGKGKNGQFTTRIARK